jgi:hypothetical protein
MTPTQLIGLLVMLAAGLMAVLAFRFGQKGRWSRALALIFLCGLTLRVFTAMDLYLHEWDERYHALVAKNLSRHPSTPTLYDQPALDYDYKGWTSNHVWIHKPPMTLYLIAGSIRIFGVHEFSVRLPSIILSSLCILLTFFLARWSFNDRVALLASFFFAINGFLIEQAVGRQPTDHVDTIFVFFVMLGVLLAWYSSKAKSAAAVLGAGVAMGCAVLTKWLPGLVIVAVYFALAAQQETYKRALLKSLLMVLVAFVVFMPWQWYIYSTFPREAAWEASFNGPRHLLEPLEGHGGTVFFQLLAMPRIFGELIYIPVLWFFVAFAKKRLPRQTLGLVVWLALPYIFFSFVATKMPGYVMISAPVVFMMLAYAVLDINERARSARHRWAALVLLAALMLLPVRYTVERIRPIRDEPRNPAWARELRELSSRIAPGKSVVFNTEHPIEAMFYTHVTAYAGIPTPREIDLCRARGFQVYVLDAATVPDAIRRAPNVTILPQRQFDDP